MYEKNNNFIIFICNFLFPVMLLSCQDELYLFNNPYIDFPSFLLLFSFIFYKKYYLFIYLLKTTNFIQVKRNKIRKICSVVVWWHLVADCKRNCGNWDWNEVDFIWYELLSRKWRQSSAASSSSSSSSCYTYCRFYRDCSIFDFSLTWQILTHNFTSYCIRYFIYWSKFLCI